MMMGHEEGRRGSMSAPRTRPQSIHRVDTPGMPTGRSGQGLLEEEDDSALSPYSGEKRRVMECGTLNYHQLHRFLRQGTDPVPNVLDKRKKRPKKPVPRIAIDPPSEMVTSMEAARPTFLRPALSMHRSHKRSIRNTREGGERADDGRAQQYIQRLTRCLDECEQRRRRHDTTRKVHPKDGHSAYGSAARMSIGGTGESAHSRNAASTSEVELTQRMTANEAAVLVDQWVLREAPQYPAAREDRGDAHATLLHRLDQARFTAPAATPAPYFHALSGEDVGHTAVEAAAAEPVTTAEAEPKKLSFPRRSASASISSHLPVELTNSGHLRRPNSATPASSSANEVAPLLERQTGDYIRQVFREPIHSYRVLHHATQPPPPRQQGSRRRVPLIGSAAIAAQRIREAEHRFDHQRFSRQLELEEFMAWRSTCRRVVSAHLCNGHAGAPEEVTEPILSGVFSVEQPRKMVHMPAAAEGASPPPVSVWTTKAYEVAMEKEKERMVSLIRTFQLPFSASILSVEAMEALRSDIIFKVMHKPCDHLNDAFFSQRDLIAFLVKRNHLQGALANVYRVKQSDVVDAMASPAEASLVTHVFGILPE